jgi:hypothetical protein
LRLPTAKLSNPTHGNSGATYRAGFAEKQVLASWIGQARQFTLTSGLAPSEELKLSLTFQIPPKDHCRGESKRLVSIVMHISPAGLEKDLVASSLVPRRIAFRTLMEI